MLPGARDTGFLQRKRIVARCLAHGVNTAPRLTGASGTRGCDKFSLKQLIDLEANLILAKSRCK